MKVCTAGMFGVTGRGPTRIYKKSVKGRRGKSKKKRRRIDKNIYNKEK